ncbi:hypothetical protein AB1Y20_006421 [Prymnesium parvum]|uniref:Uncharacterized protein n=1 Tax=Prymnesium parvum TaxID=97485 RepID=A0AB34J2P6_PRYPA
MASRAPAAAAAAPAPAVAPSSSIEDVIAEARRCTGKPSSDKDAELLSYLKSQEVASASDFFNLSAKSFEVVAQHPAVTLVMADALRRLREKPDKPEGTADLPSKRAKLSPPAAAAASLEPLCSVCIHEFVGIVTMEHNAKRNALGSALCSQIVGCLARCRAAGVRAVILRALPGVAVWSAGHDMREFGRSNGTTAQSGTGAFNDPLSRNDPFVQLLHEIRHCAVPVIAAVEGGVWGGACDIVACCDIVVGTPDTTFAITPAKIGLPYHASGMAHFLGVLPLHVVKWMFFSSSPLTSAEAKQYGFLNDCVPADQLSSTVLEMANTIATRAPLVVELLKKNLNTLSQGAALSADLFEELHEMRKLAWQSKDMEEGVSAFFEKRTPSFHRC